MPAPAFGFIPLPERTRKPRSSGLTMVIDRGMSIAGTTAFVHEHPEFVDVVKMGWGTARLDDAPSLQGRIFLCRNADIGVMPGGTLLEIAAVHGMADRFLDEAGNFGFTHIEVSDGTFDIGDDKAVLIRMAKARGFTVFSEVGKKVDHGNSMSVPSWVSSVEEDLGDGADKVILEGRESGSAGIYSSSGVLRRDVIDGVLSAVTIDRIVFEAPRKDQQVFFIREYGNGVNLGNVSPSDALALETLRLGLRCDTADLYHPSVPSVSSGEEITCP